MEKAKSIALKTARLISHTSLPEIAFITSFIFSRYLLNIDIQYPSEVVIPILFFAILTSVMFYLYRLVLNGWLAARAATLLLTYALFSYGYLPSPVHTIIELFLPARFETDFLVATIIALILAVLAGLFGWGVTYMVKRIRVLKNLQLHRIILFAVLFIFVVQVVKVGGRLIQIREQLGYHYVGPEFTRKPGASVQKPDIYYFVFDRYANNQVISSRFNYDNSGLTNYLATQGFVTRPDAKANYPFTMMSVGSTMAMQYNTELGKQFGNDKFQAAFAYRDILNNPPIAKLLKQDGYTYNQLGSWWDFTRVAVQADNNPTKSFRLRAFGKNFYLGDLTRDIINKSIMWPWLKKGITFGSTIVLKYDNDHTPRQNFFAQKAAIKAIATRADQTPQFTFAHFLAPHDPYIFDTDGSNPAYNGGRNDDDLDETDKYTRELTYLNTQIEEMVNTIRQKTPNAVIVIQADEGPYPKQFRHALTPKNYYDPSKLPLAEERQKFGILASYYMPGVDAATVQQNITASVNPFRFVLKQYLGYDLDMLPDCQFSTGNKFTIYSFKNETPKLQANPPAACNSL